MCVYLWRIHVVVWQKPTQYGEVIFLQLKKKKKKSMRNRILNYECQQRMEPGFSDGAGGRGMTVTASVPISMSGSFYVWAPLLCKGKIEKSQAFRAGRDFAPVSLF